MGNSQASGTAVQNIFENAENEVDEEADMDERDLDLDCETDFSRLFNAEYVHLVASTIRDVKKAVYEHFYGELEEALDDLEDEADRQTINFARFCNMLEDVDISQADLMQIFNRLDYECRGSFEVNPVLQTLRKSKKIPMNDDLNSVLKRLEDCCWMPGFVDVYVDQKDSFKQHGLRILDYVLRNRLLSPTVNCRTFELFEGACRLRERIVESRIKNLDIHSLKDGANFQPMDSLTAQTKTVVLKEGSLSGDDLLTVEVEKPELQQSRMHSGEALILWYIQLATTTASGFLPLAPELLSIALTHTRTMVSQLLPLSLCHDSMDRPSFLNVDCLHEMGKLIQLFPEKAELLEHSLSFHLACGNVSEILHCLTELNVSAVQIDCSNLLSSIDQVRRRLLQKSTRALKVDLLGCDAEGDPQSLLETNWKQSAFSTKPGETKANFVFECSEWTQFTKIKIKVANGKSAPSHGFIFVLAEWPVDAESDLKKNLELFSICDSWTESSYKSLISERLTTGNRVANPTAFFSTKDSDEVEVELDNPVIGKFIVVKFLEPREQDVDYLRIIGIKFYGVPMTTGCGHLELQISHSLSIANPLESNQLVIQSVLRFLLLVFCCQNISLLRLR